MTASALTMAVLLSAVRTGPDFDLAFAEPTGPASARLVVAGASAPSESCDGAAIGARPPEHGPASGFGTQASVSLFLGPRRIGKGTLTDVLAARDARGVCRLVATAVFDRPLPLAATGDVLWASTTRRWTEAPRPPRPGALARALAALPAGISQSCREPTQAAARGVEGGTYVGLTCGEGPGATFALVHVPGARPARLLTLERGAPVRLVDVLDPQKKTRHALVLERERGGTRQLELWLADGRSGSRLWAGAARRPEAGY